MCSLELMPNARDCEAYKACVKWVIRQVCSQPYRILRLSNAASWQAEKMDCLRSLWKKEEQLRKNLELLMQQELIKRELVMQKEFLRFESAKNRVNFSRSRFSPIQQCGELAQRAGNKSRMEVSPAHPGGISLGIPTFLHRPSGGLCKSGAALLIFRPSRQSPYQIGGG